ncbi:hypothetical protein D3C72_2267860 [compost metagenome]
MGGDPLCDGEVTPFGPAIQFGLVIRQIEQPATAKTKVFAEVGADLLPQFEALGR